MTTFPLAVMLQFKRIFFLVIASVFFLIGCGGGSGSKDTKFIGGKTDMNVALASNGGTASAQYNQVSAPNVNDGDNSISEYWSGNIVDDVVTVDFGDIRFLKEISIYTNEPIFNASTPNRVIELSLNGSDWFSTAQASGADIDCQTLLPTTNKITCTFASRQESRFFRFTTKRVVNPEQVNVYELEAIGY